MDPADDHFESLTKLMALKRYEEPPPGYFDRLPSRIIGRIVHEEEEPTDWLRSFFGRFEFRPALAGAFGFTLGAFYLLGVGYSGHVAARPADPAWLVHERMTAEARNPIVWTPVTTRPVTAYRVSRPGSSSMTPVLHTVPAVRFPADDRVERASYTPWPR